MKSTVLRFVLKTSGNPFDVMGRFNPHGRTVLNRTEWRGKEPRSCAVTRVKGRAHAANSPEPHVWDVEVSYRPKGTITFVGDTKYDGWTAMMLDRKKDGTLLDGHGNPLPEGAEPVYRPYEVYGDVEFNDIDFGEFIDEVEATGIKHVAYDDVMQQAMDSGHFSASVDSSFVAPRRQRPSVKIILSNQPSGTARDGFGTKIINVNNNTLQLKQVILDHLTELISGFIEGRYSIKNMATGEFVFAELDDVLVDCTPNERGEDSRFDILHEYVPEGFLEEMAHRLMSTYEVDVSIVDGKKGGLLIKRLPSRRWGRE